jgi:hypothetical protein
MGIVWWISISLHCMMLLKFRASIILRESLELERMLAGV